MKLKKKQDLKRKRCWRIRKKVNGTQDKPRLTLYISNQHIYAQCINDVQGKTICALSTSSNEVKDKKFRANVASASSLGEIFGQKAKSAGIEKAQFDRNGKQFHGAVKAFAEGVRKSINI